MATALVIEEESGTCGGFVHPHNGYYAGDSYRADPAPVVPPAGAPVLAPVFGRFTDGDTVGDSALGWSPVSAMSMTARSREPRGHGFAMNQFGAGRGPRSRSDGIAWATDRAIPRRRRPEHARKAGIAVPPRRGGRP